VTVHGVLVVAVVLKRFWDASCFFLLFGCCSPAAFQLPFSGFGVVCQEVLSVGKTVNYCRWLCFFSNLLSEQLSLVSVFYFVVQLDSSFLDLSFYGLYVLAFANSLHKQQSGVSIEAFNLLDSWVFAATNCYERDAS